jgi:hypothetical protein
MEAGMSIAGTNGQNNTAVGINALRSSHAFFSSTAVGQNCLTVSTYHGATAYGSNTCSANTTGESNNGFGYFTLNEVTTGNDNAAFGTEALRRCTTGTDNTGMGVGAIQYVTTGSNNTAVGYNSGNALTTGSSCILIGKEANVSSSGVSELVIGNAVSGQGNNTGKIYPPGGGGIYQATNGTSFLQTSDKRIKKNIVDNNEGLNKLKDIQVRNFEYRTEDEVTELPSNLAVKKEGIQLGVIAQEIEKVLPEIITIESSGVKTVNADNLTWYLINAVKELSTTVDQLKQEITILKGE